MFPVIVGAGVAAGRRRPAARRRIATASGASPGSDARRIPARFRAGSCRRRCAMSLLVAAALVAQRRAVCAARLHRGIGGAVCLRRPPPSAAGASSSTSRSASAFGGAIYVVFVHGLGLQLPAGDALGEPAVDALTPLLHGFAVALTPLNLLWALIGVTLGTAVGVLPGIGPALTVAMLLPATGKLDPVGAFIMFGGIYYGAMYGGSTTSILLNTPGENSSVVTAIEGHQMAKNGRGAAALATAAIGSFVAGTLATFALALFAPVVVQVRAAIRPGRLFRADAAGLHHRHRRARLVDAARPRQPVVRPGDRAGRHRHADRAGAAHARPAATARRHPGGHPRGRAVRRRRGAVRGVARSARRRDDHPGARPHLDDHARNGGAPGSRGCAAPLIGFPFGALPAGGAEIPTFLSYAVEKKLSKHPEEFGHGAIEGVAGPEATNNSAVTGVLVPLLTLGLPTSATAAIMLVAFQQYGLQPGPLLFASNPDLVWGLIATLYIGNVMLLVLNLPLAASGCGCSRSRGRISMAASSCSRASASTACTARCSISASSTSSACSAT